MDESPGAGERNDALVKLEVLPGIALYVFIAEGFLKSVNAEFQLGQVGIGNSLRSQARGQALQILADQKKLEDVFFRKLHDKGAPLGKNFHQSLFFQPIDRFPNRSSADPKGLGQLDFVQLFSGRNPSFQDDAFQFLVRLTSQREVGRLDLLHKSPKCRNQILYNLYIMHFIVSSFFSWPPFFFSFIPVEANRGARAKHLCPENPWKQFPV